MDWCRYYWQGSEFTGGSPLCYLMTAVRLLLGNSVEVEPPLVSQYDSVEGPSWDILSRGSLVE